MLTPTLVQILTGVAGNFITHIHVGREFDDGRRRAAARRRRSALVWRDDRFLGRRRARHLDVEHPGLDGRTACSSSRARCRRIEIYTPNRDATGKFLGLGHETVFYDPEALVEPIRIVRTFKRQTDFDEGDPYVFPECLQTIYPIQGRPTPVAPPNVIEFEVPDMYGRPWAQLWEKYFEAGDAEAGGRGRHFRLRLTSAHGRRLALRRELSFLFT